MDSEGYKNKIPTKIDEDSSVVAGAATIP